ncbi:hypothetical protein [Clostridium botulinum]|uniref:hypothetical protein n=1 Tax=Clostridium botulinum TaxID=1491 RepID=UPI00031FEFA0|nr:hypothetical protein [Clostridium botulinum]KEI01582.1 hypothetical protein Z952_12090 [Clostridium botulinum C/D str. BKT75002]KEI07916.1 hypothetical protein Z954_03225 [Clostridium botulinum C/D str. BKT2873]KLU74233.1 hypothetical protein CBC3_p0231 [Clostridium botulinum V891]QPW61557.1 hypothetical protein IG390_05170 [Clostridium botulinum]
MKEINTIDIFVEEGLYFIQKEILRTVKFEDRDLKIWFGNGEFYGYSDNYTKIEIETSKLNSKNKNKDVRYVIQEIKELK